MKTTAIDTNALLNYLLERNPHFQQVKSLFERCMTGTEEVFIPQPVLLECEWVMRSVYHHTKNQIIKFFQELLLIKNVILNEREQFELAINLYNTAISVSFTDCLILTQIQNFAPDEFLTFDEDLRKLYLLQHSGQ